jgi:hypothetical protein
MDQPTESHTPLPPHKNNLVQKKQIAMGALIVLALVALLLLNSNRASAPIPTPEEEVVRIATTTPEVKGPTTLSALIAQNVAQECTFTTASEGTETFGTVYVANGMMRTDIQTRTAQGPLQKSSMIHDGAFLYVWGDQMEQGIKMAVPDTTTSTDTAPTNTPQTPIDLNQEVTYDCAPSSPSSSVFVVPTTIMFVDMQSMLQGVPEAKKATEDSLDLTADACAACEQLPKEQQLQCRQALKCATQ